MPLVSRPFSVNTYCLSKVWFRTGSVDLRVGDIKTITSKIKSYIYQDLFQKPSEVLLYRTVEEGGLGLHHVESKALAHLIVTFLQTASGHRFQRSLYHSSLYRYHVEEETHLPDPGFTPYYNKQFFKTIKHVRDDTPLNPLHMTIKEWYRFLVEHNVTRREVDNEGRSEIIPCRVEVKYPEVFWSESFRICRLRGLSPAEKSFLFKMIHLLLPSKERVFHLTNQGSSQCGCHPDVPETYEHLFFQCEKNAEAGQSLIRCAESYCGNTSVEGILRLELTADDPFLLPCAIILATGLRFIWENRKLKKNTTVFAMRTELEMATSIRRKARSKSIQEAGSIMANILNNFFTVDV